ncbi:MAG: hypothetical protein DYG89_45100 [Caldilinea sp. CFX5]|nr:hypothetical protein [Caldilinea sp. CFX5]
MAFFYSQEIQIRSERVDTGEYRLGKTDDDVISIMKTENVEYKHDIYNLYCDKCGGFAIDYLNPPRAIRKGSLFFLLCLALLIYGVIKGPFICMQIFLAIMVLFAAAKATNVLEWTHKFGCKNCGFCFGYKLKLMPSYEQTENPFNYTVDSSNLPCRNERMVICNNEKIGILGKMW